VRQDASITVCGIEHDTQVLYGVLETGGSAGDELRGIEEKPFRTDLVNAGMYVVDPDLLALVPSGPSGMPDLIERALDGPRPVGVYRIQGHWYDIGSHDEFHRVSRIFGDPASTASTANTTNAAHTAETTEESSS
jgi:NDP-sugar pyrophosphorylase family protein